MIIANIRVYLDGSPVRSGAGAEASATSTSTRRATAIVKSAVLEDAHFIRGDFRPDPVRHAVRHARRSALDRERQVLWAWSIRHEYRFGRAIQGGYKWKVEDLGTLPVE
jgi:hypothetical protein